MAIGHIHRVMRVAGSQHHIRPIVNVAVIHNVNEQFVETLVLRMC